MAVYDKVKFGELTREEDALRKELVAAFVQYSDARLRWFEAGERRQGRGGGEVPRRGAHPRRRSVRMRRSPS
jgi:hypothetical protein